MESEYEQGICGLIVYALICKRKRRKVNVRKYWTKQWRLNTHTNLLDELRIYPNDFHNYSQMYEDTYLELLRIVSPLIERRDTVMRAAITPRERLTATLRFLSTVRSL